MQILDLSKAIVNPIKNQHTTNTYKVKKRVGPPFVLYRHHLRMTIPPGGLKIVKQLNLTKLSSQ
jgi:hypothetical protein